MAEDRPLQGEGKVTLSEALAEADREWEARVIPNGKEMNWNGHKLRFELSPSDCVGCFFKDKNECPECDDGAWVEDSPWCTGTPKEEGWYLLKIKSDDEIIYDTDKLIQCLWGLDWKYAHKEIIEWQKIEEN